MGEKTGRKLTDEQKAKLRKITWVNHNIEFLEKLASSKELTDKVREFIQNYKK